MTCTVKPGQAKGACKWMSRPCTRISAEVRPKPRGQGRELGHVGIHRPIFHWRSLHAGTAYFP